MSKEPKFFLLPPPPAVCQECAVDHPPDAPHDKMSLYYQYKFYKENDRWPTWIDAMAHCDKEMKEKWSKALIERGEKIE